MSDTVTRGDAREEYINDHWPNDCEQEGCDRDPRVFVRDFVIKGAPNDPTDLRPVRTRYLCLLHDRESHVFSDVPADIDTNFVGRTRYF